MTTGLSVSKEAIGAFIDAVYAIAVTILALELPKAVDNDTELVVVGQMLVNYCISFCILFALWVQHRRINLNIDTNGPTILWLNAAILMLVCLIPRATAFVFESGGEVDVRGLEQAAVHLNWTLSAVIDIGFVAIVLASDIGLVVLLFLTPKETRTTEVAEIYRSKVTISTLLIMVMAASLILPFQNRFFLVALPIFLVFEHRIAVLVVRVRRRIRAN